MTPKVKIGHVMIVGQGRVAHGHAYLHGWEAGVTDHRTGILIHGDDPTILNNNATILHCEAAVL
jgi:hypothetical protein